jgi:hypothetical protein
MHNKHKAEDGMDPIKNREEVDSIYDAAELAVFAIIYMMRKTRDLAVDLNSITQSMAADSPGAETAANLLNKAKALLEDSRSQLGNLMEALGDYRNNTDALTLHEMEITRPAFDAMHDRDVAAGK